MKKFYFILIFLFLFQAITNAASHNVWKKHCIKNQKNKEVCSVSTKLTLTNEKQEVLGNLVIIDIRYFSRTEKNLNLMKFTFTFSFFFLNYDMQPFFAFFLQV